MKIVENANMKLIKDKKLLVGADNSGSSLKNVIVAHLRKKGWEIEDVGAMSPEENNPDNMFLRRWALKSPRHIFLMTLEEV